MIEEFDKTVKQVGNEIIELSAVLDHKMEKWSDVSTRPYNLSETECVGFINKESAAAGLNLVVDIQTPNDKREATLRVWAIESKQGENQTERFNNIQLDFTMDYNQASALTKKGGAVTRDNIRAALHDPNTKLAHVVVSNQSGLDKASQQSLGERYDLTISELDDDTNLAEKVMSAAAAVLDVLKESAATESKL